MNRLFPAIILCLLLTLAGCGGKVDQSPNGNTVKPTLTQRPKDPTNPSTANPKKAETIGVSSTAPVPRVDAVILRALPAAVNLDDKPGPDGINVSVNLFRTDKPLAVKLQAGVIELLMYDGKISATELARAEPVKVWRYPAGLFSRAGSDAAVGYTYRVALAWGKNTPSKNTVTISARLLRPGRSPLYAMPSIISIGVR